MEKKKKKKKTKEKKKDRGGGMIGIKHIKETRTHIRLV